MDTPRIPITPIFLNRRLGVPRERKKCYRADVGAPRYSVPSLVEIGTNIYTGQKYIHRVIDFDARPFLTERLVEIEGRIWGVFKDTGIWAMCGRDNYIRRLVRIIWDRHNKRNYEYRDYEACKLNALAEDLELIKEYDNTAFLEMGRSLLAFDPGHWWINAGTRLEIFLAGILVSRGISFDKHFDMRRDKGDFIIKYGKDSLVIEAVTASISRKMPGSSSFRYKIESAIKSKSSKDKIVSKSNLLVCDFSDVYYHQIPIGDAGVSSFYGDIEWLGQLAEESGFGSVLFIQWQIIDDHPFVEPEIDFTYRRFDTGNVGDCLAQFLDLHFPFKSDRKGLGSVILASAA